MARNKHPEITVELILNTAQRLFVEIGYEKTSMQNIMDETGLSKGAIYHHFKSKEEIFNVVAERIGEENVKRFEEIRHSAERKSWRSCSGRPCCTPIRKKCCGWCRT